MVRFAFQAAFPYCPVSISHEQHAANYGVLSFGCVVFPSAGPQLGVRPLTACSLPDVECQRRAGRVNNPDCKPTSIAISRGKARPTRATFTADSKFHLQPHPTNHAPQRHPQHRHHRPRRPRQDHAWSTACSARAANSAPANWSANAFSTPTNWSANAASRSWPRISPCTTRA